MSAVGSATVQTAKPTGLRAVNLAGGSAVPYLAWSSVGGADHYEVQIAADPAFRAPVSAGADILTANTRVTLAKTLPSHRYWWRVQAISKAGSPSGWPTGAHFFDVNWHVSVARSGSATQIQWTPVRGAAKYSVELSSDPSFAAASLIGGRAIVTASNSITPTASLPKNTYYWRVTPLDAEGNPSVGTPKIFELSATGVGGSGINPPQDCIVPADLTDFASGTPDTVFCPELSWQPVPGAGRYEVEINPDDHWSAGARVCCDVTTAATRYTPTVSLLSNKYYWRVRGIDGSGNAGPWFGPPDPQTGLGADADSFTKTFDNVCRIDLAANCISSQQSVPGLHLEDAAGNALATGSTTTGPVIRWNAVPGASSYEYQVVQYIGGCNWGAPAGDSYSSHGTTATTAWTPLGNSTSGPYPDRASIAHESRQLSANTDYCVRVRAQSDRDPHGRPVYGDFTYLPDADHPSFRFGGYPANCSAVSGGVVSGSVAPTDGRQLPLFRWTPSPCAASYWIIVARDASFTNLVDYAFTRIPAYAPRKATTPMTYPDETTSYYWIALPSPNSNGACLGSACDPLSAHAFAFDKQVPPTSLQLVANVAQPTFNWNPVPGARHYELQVSQDSHFGSSFVEKVTTVATSYTATGTYPPGKELFWRVRADDETLTGLSWANWAEGKPFTVQLAAPTGPRTDPTGAGGIATLRWNSVEGAVSYDVHLQLPNGSSRDYSNLRAPQLTLSALSGTGAFRWQVRARFAKGGGTIPGPYSSVRVGTQTVWQPSGMRTLVAAGRGVVLAWTPVLYARGYRVAVSSRRDFGSLADSTSTDNPSYAPKLTGAYAKGGTFYWRVAAVDTSGNTGKYTKPLSFHLRAAPGGR